MPEERLPEISEYSSERLHELLEKGSVPELIDFCCHVREPERTEFAVEFKSIDAARHYLMEYHNQSWEEVEQDYGAGTPDEEYLVAATQLMAEKQPKQGTEEVQERVRNIGTPEEFLDFARDVPGAIIPDLQRWLLNDPHTHAKLVYEFARDVPGADIQECQEWIRNSHDPDHIRTFARDIPGADVQEIQEDILENGDAREAYLFAKEVPGANPALLYEHAEFIMFSGMTDSAELEDFRRLRNTVDLEAQAWDRILEGVDPNTIEDLHCDFEEFDSLELDRFPNLISVDCSYNQIMELDLRSTPRLVEIDCSHNAIPELDVSVVPRLRYLWCAANEMEILRTGILNDLRILNTSDNALTWLNIEDSPNLRLLNCANNAIKTLNLSGAAGLKELHVEHNQLERLDLSGLTGLKTLHAQANPLLFLDIRGLDSLKTLEVDQEVGIIGRIPEGCEVIRYARPNSMKVDLDAAMSKAQSKASPELDWRGP